MKNTADFTFLQHEQPNEEAWNKLNEFAAEWNGKSAPKLQNTMNFLWTIKFPDQSDASFTKFAEALKKLKDSDGTKYHVTSQTIFGAADYLAADFVEILGISLEGFPNQPFILNEQEALGEPVPCPECGWEDMFSRPQRMPFVIDETLLDRALPDGGDKPPGGWDCVNLPNGHKLVSNRVLATFKTENVKGYELLPALVAGTNKESKRMFQLLATRVILVLHSSVPGIVFCPRCGAARSSPTSDDDSLLQQDQVYCLDRNELQGEDLFSHHPTRGAILYFAQRIHRLLVDGEFNGIVSNDAINFCPR